MAKFSLDDGSMVIVGIEHPTDDHTFEVILCALHNRSVEEMIDTSFHFRKDFQRCRRILDLALSKAHPTPSKACVEPYSRERVQIYVLGLMLHHHMDFKDLMESLRHVKDRRLDMLRGFALLGHKQYEDAEFLFDRIGYRRGVEICRLSRKDRMVSKSPDPVILCYADSSNWKLIEADTKNKDFLFRIGQSDTYQNEDNLDVQLTLIDQSILRASSGLNMVEQLEGSLDKLTALRDHGIVSAEIVYMIGKIYHIMQKHEPAAEEYKRALSLDKDYFPARFNLSRITGSLIDTDIKAPCVCDYNALLALRHCEFDVDLRHCSDLVRRLGWTIIQSRSMDKSTLSSFGFLREYVDADALDNNAAIILNNDTSAEALQSLLGRCSPEIKDYVFYNLSVIKGDLGMLEECALPEARMHIDLLTKNTNVSDISLRAYLTLSKDLVKGRHDVFSRILHGCICIDEFVLQGTLSSLDEAEDAFMSAKNSMYCVNGLGVCAAFRGNYQTATKLFGQIVEEYEGAYRNLGNSYFLEGDYSRAIENYMKALDREGTAVLDGGISRDVLRFLAGATRDVGAIKRMIDVGVDRLESLRALILLERGEIKRVKEMGLEDPEVVRELEICMERESVRKRKMAEIEEYRKRRSTR